MKKKIILNVNGKIEVKEITVRDYEHFQAQLSNPHKITRNKKKYDRKKFKKGIDNV